MDERQLYNSLKPIVNNPDVWQKLDTLLELWYNRKHRELENIKEVEEIYRAQGYIKALLQLKNLRDLVNNVK